VMAAIPCLEIRLLLAITSGMTVYLTAICVSILDLVQQIFDSVT